MNPTIFGPIETRFADLVWQNAPLSTRALIELCQKELDWKRTTTYTVLKKFCERGLFAMEDRTVTVLVTKAEFLSIQSHKFVEETFQGSLPAFVAAFSSHRKLSQEDLAQIRQLLDSFEGG